MILRQELRTAVRHDLGQTMLEFAFTLPVLLLLLFGLIDFSRAAYTAAVVQWAAQAGARAGIADVDNVTPAIQEKLIGLDADQAVVAVTFPDASTVAVQVTYPFEFVTPVIVQVTGEGFQMSGSASMIVQPPLTEADMN